MVDQRVSFETAKLAKEKGFDVPCDIKYNRRTGVPVNRTGMFSLVEHWLDSPTQSLLQRWLREKHNLKIVVWDYYERGYYYAINGKTDTSEQPLFNTYEEALEQGLIAALNLL